MALAKKESSTTTASPSRPKLVATALLALAFGLLFFYAAIPALHEGFNNPRAQWHQFVLPPNPWATDRFGNRAFIDSAHNSISIMALNANWSPLLPHLPEVQAADGTMVITLRDGSSATFPIVDGFAKQFLIGAPADVNLVRRPLDVYSDSENRPRLIAVLSQYREKSGEPSKGVSLSDAVRSAEQMHGLRDRSSGPQSGGR